MTKLGSKNTILETVKLLLDRASPVLVDEACIKLLTKLVHQELEGLGDGDEDDLFEWNESSGESQRGRRAMFLLVVRAHLNHLVMVCLSGASPQESCTDKGGGNVELKDFWSK